jgi:hypothetical protein
VFVCVCSENIYYFNSLNSVEISFIVQHVIYLRDFSCTYNVCSAVIGWSALSVTSSQPSVVQVCKYDGFLPTFQINYWVEYLRLYIVEWFISPSNSGSSCFIYLEEYMTFVDVPTHLSLLETLFYISIPTIICTISIHFEYYNHCFI